MQHKPAKMCPATQKWPNKDEKNGREPKVIHRQRQKAQKSHKCLSLLAWQLIPKGKQTAQLTWLSEK